LTAAGAAVVPRRAAYQVRSAAPASTFGSGTSRPTGKVNMCVAAEVAVPLGWVMVVLKRIA
jgi:hypothetical protein